MFCFCRSIVLKFLKLCNLHEIAKDYGNVSFRLNHVVVDMTTVAMSMEVVAFDPTVVDINVNGQDNEGGLRHLP